MATLNSINYAKIQNNQKVGPGEQNARVKAVYDSYALSAVINNNDEIDSLNLPEGAIISKAWIKSPSMGATGIFQMGLRAHEDPSETAVAEDPDGLVAS